MTEISCVRLFEDSVYVGVIMIGRTFLYYKHKYSFATAWRENSSINFIIILSLKFGQLQILIQPIFLSFFKGQLSLNFFDDLNILFSTLPKFKFTL